MTDHGHLARVGAATLLQAVRDGHQPPHADQAPDPRLVAAETVANAALHLVMQWPAWQALNAAALAAELHSPEDLLQALNAAVELHEEGRAVLDALAAFELLDAAVNLWAPHVHPAVSLRSLPPRTRRN